MLTQCKENINQMLPLWIGFCNFEIQRNKTSPLSNYSKLSFELNFTFMKNLLYILLITFSSLLQGQDNVAYVRSLDKPESISKSSKKDVLETNFELRDRLIFMEASLNGKTGKYILDTGAPMLMVNANPKNATSNISSISKSCKAEIIKVEEFNWGGTSNKSVEAIAFDMTDLEKITGEHIDGLIGQNMFSNFELYLDIANRKVQLHRAYRSKLHKNNKPSTKIPFSLHDHLPVITVKIDGKKYKFGIDTGAEVNVIDKDIAEKLPTEFFHNLVIDDLQGVDGKPQFVKTASLNNFEVKNNSYKNFKFFFVDLNHLQTETSPKLDGILGFPFFEKNAISINYKKQRLYIW